MSKRIQVTLSDNVYDKVVKLAEQREETLSAFIKHCVVVYLTAYEKKRG